MTNGHSDLFRANLDDSDIQVLVYGVASPKDVVLAYEPLGPGQAGGPGIPALGKAGVMVLFVFLSGLEGF